MKGLYGLSDLHRKCDEMKISSAASFRMKLRIVFADMMSIKYCLLEIRRLSPEIQLNSKVFH